MYQIAFLFLFGVILGYFVSNSMKKEGFQNDVSGNVIVCSNCGGDYPCANCDSSSSAPVCPPMPDMTKYVLKSSIPPCPTCPDLSMYMLKTECPPAVNLSQYVLKSSIPKPEPIIIDNSKCAGKNVGDCPPCPRPRCPEVKCPGPISCPACPPCERTKCPEKVVKCKAEDTSMDPVRPYLTPLSVTGFGAA
jgi:hypothetical protein